jgi:hypothetical protein
MDLPDKVKIAGISFLPTGLNNTRNLSLQAEGTKANPAHFELA